MVIFFFIGNLFYLIKARLSVYKSNFQQRAFFKVSIATSTAREDLRNVHSPPPVVFLRL
jgi:hypothetical protein